MPILSNTQVNCVVCKQPFLAQVEQILDVGSEPAGKERLLSGQLNVVTCPRCGRTGRMNTPLLYHDPAHELLLVLVPMDLNLPPVQREQLIGGLTRNLMSRIPAEARMGYLFSPQTVLTWETLVERVLEAEGIPAEVLERQRKQGELLDRLMSASAAELVPLVEAHDVEIDEGFFQLLSALITSSQRADEQAATAQLTQLRNRLLALASWSRRRGITPEMLEQQETRLNLLDEFLNAEESDWPTISRQHDGELDYLFFQLLTAAAEGAPEDLTNRLFQLRSRLLELTSTGQDLAAGQQAIDDLENAAQAAGGITREVLLGRIMAADGDKAVDALAVAASPLLDYAFFLLLADRIDEASKRGDAAEAGRLTALREHLVSLTEQWERAKSDRIGEVNREIERLIGAPDPEAAVLELLPEIDQLFLSVLASRTDAAKKAGEGKKAAAYQGLLSRILAQMEADAPPEIRLINQLIRLEGDAAIEEELLRRRDELTSSVLAAIEGLSEDLRARDQPALADRVTKILALARRVKT